MNAKEPIIFSFEGDWKITRFKLSHSKNADDCISVIEDGNTICESDEQNAKTQEQIVFNDLEKTTCFKFMQLEKAL